MAGHARERAGQWDMDPGQHAGMVIRYADRFLGDGPGFQNARPVAIDVGDSGALVCGGRCGRRDPRTLSGQACP